MKKVIFGHFSIFFLVFYGTCYLVSLPSFAQAQATSSSNYSSPSKSKTRKSSQNASAITQKDNQDRVLYSDGGKQVIEERVERKFSLSPYVGIGVFPRTIAYNDYGLASNLFEGYKPTPVFGAMLMYKYKKRVFWGGNFSFFYARRELNSLSVLTSGVFGKLNLTSGKKRVTPYIIAGLDLYLTNVNQNKKTIETTPDSAEVGFDVIRSTISFNRKYVLFAPMVGPMAGLGIDIKYNKKFSLFFQGSVHSSIGASPLLNRSFPENESVLQMAQVSGGVRIRLLKKLRFEIDSEFVRVPDLIVWLSPPESEEVPQQMLSREANFAVNLREGMRHNVQVATNSAQINIQLDQDESNPCKILAILYDAFGNKVAVAEPQANGHVQFDGLQKGTYNVVFENQPPCNGSKFSYTLTEPGSEVVSQHFTEQEPADSLQYVIEGMVDFKDPAVPKENVHVMLVDQNTKQVTARQLTDSKGYFTFKNLPPGQYKVVYEVGTPTVQSKLSYEISTNKDSLIQKVDFPYNEIRRVSEGSRLMVGKISMADPTLAAYKVNLDLVDKYNRVIDKSVPNLDGSFEFIDNMAENNEIIFDPQGLRKKEELSKPVIAQVTYEPKVEAVKKENKINAMASMVEPAPNNANSPPPPPEFEMYKLYDITAQELKNEGFGFQVGAFKNRANANSLMEKLKAEGFEPYVQMVWSYDISKRFRTLENFKINRVIVFGGNEETKAANIRLKLIENGYEIIVKEHFKKPDP